MLFLVYVKLHTDTMKTHSFKEKVWLSEFLIILKLNTQIYHVTTNITNLPCIHAVDERKQKIFYTKKNQSKKKKDTIKGTTHITVETS